MIILYKKFQNLVADVLLPYYVLVKTRGRIEHLERLFGLTYVNPIQVSQETQKNSMAMYEFHLMKWEWIWDNCLSVICMIQIKLLINPVKIKVNLRIV